MTRDDIIRMAREAGMAFKPGLGIAMADDQKLERFAALVAAAEREACAKVCEESNAFDWPECAAAIRARGQA
jgi:hypothetical protein